MSPSFRKDIGATAKQLAEECDSYFGDVDPFQGSPGM